jgi:hypothetical protein
VKLGLFKKTPIERKRYSLDYTDWLDTGETIIAVTFTVTPTTGASPLEVDAYQISVDGKEISFFVDDGDDSVDYEISVVVTTSGGQIKEDEIGFVVREL